MQRSAQEKEKRNEVNHHSIALQCIYSSDSQHAWLLRSEIKKWNKKIKINYEIKKTSNTTQEKMDQKKSQMAMKIHQRQLQNERSKREKIDSKKQVIEG